MNRLFWFFFFHAGLWLNAQTYYVSVKGSDSQKGTLDQPFKTIQKAVDLLQPGDTCYIRAGVYHEKVVLKQSGTASQPIVIEAYPKEKVVLDGREVIKGDWVQVKKNIFKIQIGKHKAVDQLFVGETPMVEARYPNLDTSNQWNASNWANAEKGSKEGLLIHKGFKNIRTDWTHTHLMLNGAHQFVTWSRPVRKVDTETNSLSYDFGVKLTTMNPKPWDDDRFYLFGSLGLLDAPNEWVYQADTGDLYFYGTQKEREQLAIKTIAYGLRATNLQHIKIKGLQFFACTFQFKACAHIHFSDSQLQYPTHTRLLTDSYPQKNRQPLVETLLSGSYNTIENVTLSHTNTTGIVVEGYNNLIKNCHIFEVNTTGALDYAGIRLGNSDPNNQGHNQIVGCTLHHMGQSAIYFRGPNNLIRGNHIHNVGLASKDQAAIQTVNPSSKGSHIEENFIHHCTEKGIRADYQSRGLTISKNIIWQCGMGMITKGEDHVVRNNYIIGEGTSGLLLIPTRAEPYKWWATVPQLKEQNASSLFKNNSIGKLAFRKKAITDADRLNNNTLLSADKIIKMERACNTYQQSIPKLLIALKHYN